MTGAPSLKRLIATIVVGIGLAAPDARADVSAAARAFSDGQSAQLEGNFERAAQSFELAYNIAPSKEALRSAIRARQLSNQLPRAATLAQLLLTQFSDDPASNKLASDVIAEAKLKLARIAITCAPQCTAAVGGRAISLNAAPIHVVFTAPGRASIEVTFDGDRNVTREVTLKAGDEVTLPIEPPPVKRVARPRTAAAPPAPVVRDDSGLPPYVAVGGGALTLVLIGITTWSALDTDKAHDAYVAAPTDEGWKDGRSKQLRTNLLLGGAAATAVSTALIAAFWTRWHRVSDSPEMAITPDRGGLSVSLGGRF
jgi:hypothetical protein